MGAATGTSETMKYEPVSPVWLADTWAPNEQSQFFEINMEAAFLIQCYCQSECKLGQMVLGVFC